MLLTQQFHPRVFSILHNAGLAFLAISITFLGLGAAGVAAAVFPNTFRSAGLGRQIPSLALAHEYGRDVTAHGPELDQVHIQSGGLQRVEFLFAEGRTTTEGKPPNSHRQCEPPRALTQGSKANARPQEQPRASDLSSAETQGHSNNRTQHASYRRPQLKTAT
jgi:hypothetical protein